MRLSLRILHKNKKFVSLESPIQFDRRIFANKRSISFDLDHYVPKIRHLSIYNVFQSCLLWNFSTNDIRNLPCARANLSEAQFQKNKEIRSRYLKTQLFVLRSENLFGCQRQKFYERPA